MMSTEQAPKRFGFSMSRLAFLGTIVCVAVITALLAGLLVNIFQRKQEAKNPYLRFVQVTEDTTDAAQWGLNWPREYDSYLKTAIQTRTNFGGGDAGIPAEKAETYPWLTRMFAGYAFALDYRDRRGHAYMLLDQEKTRRVTERPQPGACLNCHSSVVPTYRRLGEGDVQAGFVKLSAMTYQEGHAELEKTGSLNAVITGTGQTMQRVAGAHPVSCVDCHNPDTMRLRVSRPGFINGIKALMAAQGRKDYDPNRDATRQEMRTYVCAQCHVEYYCGPKVTLFFPWNNGLKVEQIESYYNGYKFPAGKGETEGHRFYDWVHSESGGEMLKAQHPEFEMWSQGIHARSGVSCADCHMPYTREGAMKVSDHWVRSPLLNVARSCQPCHVYPEEEIKARVEVIQKRNFDLMQRAGRAVVDLLDRVKVLREPFEQANRAAAQAEAAASLAKDEGYGKLGAEQQVAKLKQATGANLTAMWSKHANSEPGLKAIMELHRKAQWRLDFVAAENSMGFHAPQEASRILGEAIDYARQGKELATEYAVGHGIALPAAKTQAGGGAGH